jgi:outer membrane protein assembly factor BamB
MTARHALYVGLMLTLIGCAQSGLTTSVEGQGQPADSPVETQLVEPTLDLSTASPSPTPEPDALTSPQLLWEWEETSPPSALAPGRDQVAVLTADGRFLWLATDTGQAVGGNFLWADGIRGDSWGEVYVSAGHAAVVAVETFLAEGSGLPETRSRFVVYDQSGEEVWSLPELDDKHLYVGAVYGGIVVIGTHRGFAGNSLAAYDLLSGRQLWQVEDNSGGYELLAIDEGRVYAKLLDFEGGQIAAYGLSDGQRLWSQADPLIGYADGLLLSGGRLYVLTQPTTVALAASDGKVLWSTEVRLAAEAGMAAQGDLVYLAPAPGSGRGTRPGLVSVRATDGQVAWNVLEGFVVNPMAADESGLWSIARDAQAGRVWLIGLDAETGAEQMRLEIGRDPDLAYRLALDGPRVYVLGKSLRAYLMQ